jgi:hypothetical protein
MGAELNAILSPSGGQAFVCSFLIIVILEYRNEKKEVNKK